MSGESSLRALSDVDYPDIADDRFRTIANRWLNVTLLSTERLWSLYSALEQITRAKVPGAIVECGTFKGGSAGFMLDTLVALNDTSREIYLFDTFEGFPEGVSELLITGKTFGRSDWLTSNFATEFNANISRTNYPQHLIHIRPGQVQETIPAQAPENIALCHLDTDYYGATKHQLEHLYPRIASGGLLQIDDYGHFLGCRRAVDEYFATPGVTPIFLARVDYTGRIGVKTC